MRCLERSPLRCPTCAVRVVPESAYCHRCGVQLPASHGNVDARCTDVDDVRETTLWEGTFSWKGMAHELGLMVIATLVMAVAGKNLLADASSLRFAWGVIGVAWAVVMLVLTVRKCSVRYVLTNHRFIHNRGIVLRRVNRIESIDIDDVSVEQNLLQRILGAGEIWIRSRDESHPRFRMTGIAGVRHVSELLEQTRRAEQIRRGVFVEPV